MNTTTTTQTKTGVFCKCTCGKVTDNTYAPGHDAKHVSLMIREVLAGNIDREAARAQLPSMALRVKFDNALDNAINKAIARKEREEAKVARLAKRAVKAAERIRKEAKKAAKEETPEYTEVKVGRWWYPIAHIAKMDGLITGFTYIKRDGSEAIAGPNAKVR